MKKRLFPVALMACTVILSACSKNDGNDTSKSQADKFEDYSMTTEWINYTVAASSELLDDCIALWASWNGPTGIPDEDWERIGRDFFTKNTMVGSNGYAEYMRTAEAVIGPSPAALMQSGRFWSTVWPISPTKSAHRKSAHRTHWPNRVIRQLPYFRWSRGTAGIRSRTTRTTSISIKNGYAGRRGSISDAASENSISAYVKSVDPELDTKITQAIDDTYYAITSMQSPFRNNLTGSKVDAAIEACATLTQLFENEALGKFKETGDYDFTAILTQYADQVVVPTYKDMKTKAWALYNAITASRLTRRTKANSMPLVPPGGRYAYLGRKRSRTVRSCR